jgi:hypothetical protein
VHVFAAFLSVVRLELSGAGAGRQSSSSFATNFAMRFFLIISILARFRTRHLLSLAGT